VLHLSGHLVVAVFYSKEGNGDERERDGMAGRRPRGVHVMRFMYNVRVRSKREAYVPDYTQE